MSIDINSIKKNLKLYEEVVDNTFDALSQLTTRSKTLNGLCNNPAVRKSAPYVVFGSTLLTGTLITVNAVKCTVKHD